MNYNTKSSISFFAYCICMVLFLNSNTLFAQSFATNNSGVLTFDKEVIDYGTIAYKANGVRTFTFTNTGASPVIIAEVKTSCGCTVAEKPNTPILPGESSKITVEYSTQKVGTFSKSITVISNASEKRQVLTIKGKVLPKNPIR